MGLNGMLVDLTDVVAPIEDQFFPGVLDSVRLRNGQNRRSRDYAVPIGQYGHYIHVWKSLLDQAGISVDHIPHEWDAFWAFWCDTVQPAVRQATGPTDFYGIGLPMSADASDTVTGLDQFRDAYGFQLTCRRRRTDARRSGGQREGRRDSHRLHRGLEQGLHATRCCQVDQHRQ